MTIKECYVGARVVCVAAFACCNEVVGMTGTIVGVRDDNVGVDFDAPFAAEHRCGGLATLGHGRWGEPAYLEFEEQNIGPMNFSFEELVGL